MTALLAVPALIFFFLALEWATEGRFWRSLASFVFNLALAVLFVLVLIEAHR